MRFAINVDSTQQPIEAIGCVAQIDSIGIATTINIYYFIYGKRPDCERISTTVTIYGRFSIDIPYCNGIIIATTVEL